MAGERRPQLLFAYGDSEDELRTKLSEAREKYSDQKKLTTSSCYVDKGNTTKSPSEFAYRGYTIVDTPGDIMEIQKTVAPRSVWYCMTGNGCQWHTMGRQLMHIPLFRKTIHRCHKAVEAESYDLLADMNEADEELMAEGLGCFCVVSAIQFAMVDMLRAVGAPPDGLFGHSFGEHTCPYPDGCATLEENMLVVYHAVKCMNSVTIPLGTMAVVATGWNQCKPFTNKDVQLACNNSSTSVTVAGKTTAITQFIKDVKKKGIRAMPILKCAVPHCKLARPYMEQMDLEENIAKVITDRPRSSKWLSTSYPEDEWDTDEANTWGARYVENNYIQPVHFYQVVQKVPKNAMIIEVSPNPLFRGTILQTVGPDAAYTSLMRKDDDDAHLHLMQALGTMFISGLDINPEALFQED